MELIYLYKIEKKEYAEKDLYVCEENCNFKEYDLKTQKAVCSCDVKNSFLDSFADININSTKLLNNIVDIKNVINLKIMKCYALLFQDEKGIIKNIGFYVISPVILFHIISIIIFYVIEKKIFFKKIEDIINVREDKSEHNNEVVIESNNNKSIIYQNNGKEKKIKKYNLISSKKKNQKKRKKKKYNKNINIVQTNPNNDKKNNNIINDNSNSKIGVVNSFKNVHEINNKYMNNKFILDYNIYELNNLSYADALKYDKRNFITYYFSLLKTNHLLINSFYPINDYNSRVIKIFLFFFLFIVYLTVNSLFFNDQTIHVIYIDKGDFDFIYQLPQIIYSSLISTTINIIIKSLALSEKNIFEIKQSQISKEKIETIKRFIFYKFIAFFIVSFCFLFFFWFYLCCFCTVYENTQIHLIKDTVISFCFNLLYTTLLYFIPATFRMISLYKIKNESMYKLSKLLQLI